MYVQFFNAYLSGVLEFIIEGYNRIIFFYCRKMYDQNVREPEEPADSYTDYKGRNKENREKKEKYQSTQKRRKK